MKNKEAVALGKLRWKGKSKKDITNHTSMMREALRKKRLLKDIKNEALSPEDKKLHRQAREERRKRI